VLIAGSTVTAAPTEVTFPSGSLTLHGFIYRPPGSGPFPAVVYNHGSEARPGWRPDLGALFTARGFAFFVPHRRGQGRSAGPYIEDLLRQAPANLRAQRLVELHEEQVEDVFAGLAWLRAQPDVDPERIAVAGCSYGGIQTILAAQRGGGFRAAVSFAAAAISWRGALPLQRRLREAVRNATIPILFVQAENDYDLAPSRELASEMERAGKPHQVHIFPRYGQTPADGHGGFCEHGGDVWGPEVFGFLGATLGS
jgi:carboxymethylenebutenolidase